MYGTIEQEDAAMAMSDRQLTTLYSQLADAIGAEAASTLMELLPPRVWDQVATKGDIRASEELLRRDLSASETLLRGELKATEGSLTVEIASSESRQGARIDKTNARIDRAGARPRAGDASGLRARPRVAK